MPDAPLAYPVHDVNRVKRLHERGAYDRATVQAIGCGASNEASVPYAILILESAKPQRAS